LADEMVLLIFLYFFFNLFFLGSWKNSSNNFRPWIYQALQTPKRPFPHYCPKINFTKLGKWI